MHRNLWKYTIASWVKCFDRKLAVQNWMAIGENDLREMEKSCSRWMLSSTVDNQRLAALHIPISTIDIFYLNKSRVHSTILIEWILFFLLGQQTNGNFNLTTMLFHSILSGKEHGFAFVPIVIVCTYCILFSSKTSFRFCFCRPFLHPFWMICIVAYLCELPLDENYPPKAINIRVEHFWVNSIRLKYVFVHLFY